MEAWFASQDSVLYVGAVLGLFLAWAIGANDFSNSVGAAVGAKVVGIREAVFIAAVFELAGALFYGTHVTATFTKGLVHLDAARLGPEVVVPGVLAAMLAAGMWLSYASAKGWPVSTTHTVVGAVLGVGLAGGKGLIQYTTVRVIVAAWLVTLPLTVALGAGLFLLLRLWVVA